MSELRELYQSVILDHNKKPKNCRELPEANRRAEGHNPLCGDKLALYLVVEDDVVKDAGFRGSGCAISTAAASMMTQDIKGKHLGEIEKVFKSFHEMLTGRDPGETPPAELGKLVVFAGVREFPMRVKCATLAWHTLRAALEHRGETATTE